MKLCLLGIGFVLLLSIDKGESWPCRPVLRVSCATFMYGCHYVTRIVCDKDRKKRTTEEVSSINRQIHTYFTHMCITFSLHTTILLFHLFYDLFFFNSRYSKDISICFIYQNVIAP